VKKDAQQEVRESRKRKKKKNGLVPGAQLRRPNPSIVSRLWCLAVLDEYSKPHMHAWLSRGFLRQPAVSDAAFDKMQTCSDTQDMHLLESSSRPFPKIEDGTKVGRMEKTKCASDLHEALALGTVEVDAKTGTLLCSNIS